MESAFEKSHSLDHINTKLRTVGHNNITRCPSCAEEGHDRSGDNLSISIENPPQVHLLALLHERHDSGSGGLPTASPT